MGDNRPCRVVVRTYRDLFELLIDEASACLRGGEVDRGAALAVMAVKVGDLAPADFHEGLVCLVEQEES